VIEPSRLHERARECESSLPRSRTSHASTTSHGDELAPGERPRWLARLHAIHRRPSFTFFQRLCLLSLLWVGSAAAQPDPLSADELAQRGRSLVRIGHLKEAEDVLRRAAAARGNSIEGLYDLARVTFATGNYAKSRAACSALIAKDKTAALSNLCMARAFLVYRRATRAAEFVDLALAAEPGRAEVHLVLGDLKRVEGELAASKSAYEAVLRIDPRDPDAHYGLGKLALLSPDYDAAAREFRAAIEVEPRWPEALYELGCISSGQDAIDLLTRALSERPVWPEAKLALGAAELDTRDEAKAEALFREVLKSNPNLPMAHARLGMALAARGDLGLAESELKRGLAGLPNDADAALALARVYTRTDRAEDAFEAFRNAASLEPTGSRALVEAGAYALSLNRNTLAQAFLEKAIEKTPGSGTAQARYADALLARGDKDKAKEHYRLALAGRGTLDRQDVQRRLDALK
jgi:tetratricopeptide (TPR) repeat protein